MRRKDIGKFCYFLYGDQNSPDQLKKRSGEWYCYVQNKYIIECLEEKCPYYYSVDEWRIDNL